MCPYGQDGSSASTSAEAVGGTPTTNKNGGSGDEGEYSSAEVIGSTAENGSGDEQERGSELAIDLARSSGDTVACSAMLIFLAAIVTLPKTGVAILFS